MNTLSAFSFLFLISSGLNHTSSIRMILPEGEQAPIFVDVSNDHLPATALEGLSMDASVGDLDGDGDLDIVIANEHKPNIILINDGQGVMLDESASRIPQINHDSEDVALADFDSDGDIDIIVVSEDDKTNEFYLNDGQGFFSDAGDRIPVTGTSNACLAYDVNEDGFIDLLIGNNGQNTLLINDGEGNFTEEGIARLGSFEDVTQDLELGDIDGDGDQDLVVANEGQNRILINKGKGFFSDETNQRLTFRSEDEETREASLGDIDGDGDLDLLFANVEAFVPGALRQNRLLVNDGQGSFSDATKQLPQDRDRSFDGAFLDLDNDGDLDIVTSNINGDRFGGSTPFRAYVNDGLGTFIDQTASFFLATVTGRGLDAAYADFNNDGKKDLFLCSRGTNDLLLFGQ